MQRAHTNTWPPSLIRREKKSEPMGVWLLPAFLLRGVNLEMKLKILLCSCRGEGGTHNRLRALPLPTAQDRATKAIMAEGLWKHCLGQGGTISSSTSDLSIQGQMCTQGPGRHRTWGWRPADGRPCKLKGGPAM